MKSLRLFCFLISGIFFISEQSFSTVLIPDNTLLNISLNSQPQTALAVVSNTATENTNDIMVTALEKFLQAKNAALAKKLSESLAWKKLLHYETDFWWTTESQIDSSSFFLNPVSLSEAQKDIQGEFFADLKMFLDESANSEKTDEMNRPRCRFPARFRWMKKELPEFFERIHSNCPRFEKYFNALKGPSVSLVFSSYYLNNPSSAFGHTFLRINKAAASDGSRHELLDYGINYAANMDTDNALLYGVRGLFGMFNGSFTSVPYYYKVREYNNAESRDLWEYELSLTSDEVEQLVAHSWELGSSGVDYWYLTENCSYHVLSILEAAAPRLNILEQLKTYVLPSDTVQVVWNTPGLVKSFHFRPSIRTEFLTRESKLTFEEKKYLQSMLVSFPVKENENFKSSKYDIYDFLENDFKKLPEESRKNILDSAIDYMDYRYPVEIQKDSKEAKRKQLYLSERSEINLVTEKIKIPIPNLEQPHLAHGSRRMGVGYLSSKNLNSAYLLEYKFALHDLLDPKQGYPDYAKISFFDIQFVIEDQLRTGSQAEFVSGTGFTEKAAKKSWIEKFTIFEVISNTAIDSYRWPTSFQIRLGVDRLKNLNCWNCEAGVLEGGAGYTFSVGESAVAMFGLQGHVNYSGFEKSLEGKNIFLGLGPVLRWKYRIIDPLAIIFEWHEGEELDVNKSFYHQAVLAAQYSWQEKWGLRISGKDNLYDQQVSTALYFYY